MATNVLELVSFGSAQGPPNNDGSFAPGEYESLMGFTNPSNTELTIESVELINMDDQVFSLSYDYITAFGYESCEGYTLPPDPTPGDQSTSGACLVWVDFRPPTAGVYRGQLILHMPANNTFQVVELRGESNVPAPSGTGTDPSEALPSDAITSTFTPAPPGNPTGQSIDDNAGSSSG